MRLDQSLCAVEVAPSWCSSSTGRLKVAKQIVVLQVADDSCKTPLEIRGGLGA